MRKACALPGDPNRKESDPNVNGKEDVDGRALSIRTVRRSIMSGCQFQRK